MSAPLGPLLAAILLGLGACAADAPARDEHAITGTIDAGEGIPVRIAGAAKDSTTTGPGGDFAFRNLPAGDYTVSPAQAEYLFEPASYQVRLGAGEPARVLTFRRGEPTEGVPADVLAHIDTLPDSPLKEDEIILPNGMRLSDFRRQMEAQGLWTGEPAEAPAAPALAPPAARTRDGSDTVSLWNP